jgi:hypothetical protein
VIGKVLVGYTVITHGHVKIGLANLEQVFFRVLQGSP